jgi:hypothetical protein
MPPSSSPRRRLTALPWPFLISVSLGRKGGLEPRTQAPDPHQNGPEYGGRLFKEAVLAGELGGAPRVALLKGARYDLPPGPHAGAKGQANTARAEVEAAHPGETKATPFLTPHSALAALSGGAAAEEGQDAPPERSARTPASPPSTRISLNYSIA